MRRAALPLSAFGILIGILPVLPASALAASTDTAAGWLSDKAGRPAFDALRAKGYVVVQGEKHTERLQYVHWKSLASLAGLSGSATRLADSLRALAAGQPAKSAPEDLDRLAALSPQGLMTPALHTAAQTLAAIQRQLAKLGHEGGTVAAALSAQQPLFDTPWGAKLAAESRADLADDPSGIVDRYFSGWLAGPAADPAAVAHFQDYAKRKAPEAVAQFESDAKAGRLSNDLRRALERYFDEHRRLAELERLNVSLNKHLKAGQTQKDLAALEAAARGLSDAEVLRGLEVLSIPALPANAPRPKLTSAGVHMQEPTRLGQYELGDEAIVTGGYWVDGLKEGESVEVEEATFAERPSGLETIRSNKARRANGGPYPYSARLPVGESRDLVFHAIVSAPGSNALSERLTVPVSRDFETALAKLAAADAAVSACRFDGDGYTKLAAELAPSAKEKKQYDALRKTAEARAKQAQEHAKTLSRLESLIAESHADANPETCDYQTKRTVDALAIARKLPAGCDRFVPALDRRLFDIRRRKDAQAAYERWASEARSKRKDCAFASASESAAAALAVLDAEPAARCGKLNDDAAKLEKELMEARAASAWKSRLEEEVKASEASDRPEARLAAARALAARASSLPDAACFAKERDRAEKTVSAAWTTLDASTGTLAHAVLPADSRIAKVEAEVAAERKSQLKARRAEEGKLEDSQSPAPSAKTNGAAVPEPAVSDSTAAPAAKRTRLQCLEDGFRDSKGALIDCEGKPFKIMELKRLRDAQSAPVQKKAAPRKKPNAR